MGRIVVRMNVNKPLFWLLSISFLYFLYSLPAAEACSDYPCLLFSDSDRQAIYQKITTPGPAQDAFNLLQTTGNYRTGGCPGNNCPDCAYLNGCTTPCTSTTPACCVTSACHCARNDPWNCPRTIYQESLFKAWVQNAPASSFDSGITALMNEIAEPPFSAEIEIPERVMRMVFAAELAWDKLSSQQKQTVVNTFVSYIDYVKNSGQSTQPLISVTTALRTTKYTWL